MFEYNGQLIDADTLQGWADEDGKSVEQYMSTYGISKVDNNSPSSKNTRRNFVFKGNEVDYNTVAQWAAEDNKTVDEYVSAYDLTELGKQTSQTPGAAANVTTALDGESSSDLYLSEFKNVIERAQKKADSKEEEWLKQADAVENKEWTIMPVGVGTPIISSYKTANYFKFAKEAKEQAKEGENWEDIAKRMYVQSRRQKFIEKEQEAFLDDLKSEETGFFSLNTLQATTPVGAIEKLTGFDLMETGYEKRRKELSEALDNISEEKASLIKYTEAKLPDLEKSLTEKSARLNQILAESKKDPNYITEEVREEFVSLKDSFLNDKETFDDLVSGYMEAAEDAKDYKTAASLTARSHAMTDIIPATVMATLVEVVGSLNKLQSEISGTGVLDRLGLLDENVPEGARKIMEYMPLLGNKPGQIAADFLFGQAERIRGDIQKPQDFEDANSLSDYTRFTAELFAGQAVNTAITLAVPPIGLVIMGASAAGNKMMELDKQIAEGKEVTPLQYYGASAGYGLFEALTEKVAASKFLKGTKFLKGKLGLGDGFNISPRYDINTMTWTKATANWALDVGEEGGTEWLAQLGQNAIDKYVLGEDVSLTQGLNSAFWSGAIMSGLGFNNPILAGDFYRAAATTNEIKIANKKGKEMQSRIAELNRLLKIPKEQKTKETWEAIAIQREALDEINRDLHSAMKKNADRLDKLGRQDKDRLLRYNAKQYEIKKQISSIANNKELSDADKKAKIEKLQSSFNNIDSSKNKILKEAAFSQDAKNVKRKKFIDMVKSGLGTKITYISADNADDIKSQAQSKLDNLKNITEDERTELQAQIDNIGLDGNGNQVDFHGVALGDNTSLPMVLVNSKTAPDQDAFVISHEIGHQTLFQALVKSGAEGIALVEAGIDYMAKRYKKIRTIAEDTEKFYRSKGITDERILAEEKLAAISSYMRDFDISKDKTFQGKLLSLWGKIKNKEYDNIENINTGEDVFRMLQDYTNSFERGELAETTLALLKGDITVGKGIQDPNVAKSTGKNSLTTRIKDIEWNDNFNAGPAAFIETAGRRFVVRLMRKVAFINQYEPADKDLIQLAKSLGIDKDSNGVPVAESDKFYELGFEDMEIPGDSITGKLDTSSIKVFGAVVNSVLDLIKNNKDAYEGIIFKGKQDNRFRLYNSMANLIAGKIGGEVVSQNNKVFVNLRPKTKPAVRYSLSKEDNAKLASVHKKGTDNIYRIPSAYETVQAVASAITKKYFNPIPADARNGVTYDEYEMSAISELALIGREWDPEKQDFGKFLANRGFIRLSNLASKLGIESTVERGGIGITADVETSKEAQSQSEEVNIRETAEAGIIDKDLLSEQIDLSNEVDGKSMIDNIKDMLARNIKLAAKLYNEEVSKNRTVTPFIENIRIGLAEDLRKQFKTFINNYGYAEFLADHKKVILDNYTTTYLSKHPLFKSGIQKSINGKWVSPIEIKPGIYDFVDKDGKKYPRGTFDRETAGVGGKTSGPEIIRRNPDINKIITTNKFVDYHFQDGAQRKKKKQNPEDALARQLGSEIGFELLVKDFKQQGPLFEQFKDISDLFGNIIQVQDAEKVIKQVDRGTVKYALSPEKVSNILDNNWTGRLYTAFEQNELLAEVKKLFKVSDQEALADTSVLQEIFDGVSTRNALVDADKKDIVKKLNKEFEDGFTDSKKLWLFAGGVYDKLFKTIRYGKDFKIFGLTKAGEKFIQDFKQAIFSKEFINNSTESKAKFIEDFIYYDSTTFIKGKRLDVLKTNETFYNTFLKDIISTDKDLQKYFKFEGKSIKKKIGGEWTYATPAAAYKIDEVKNQLAIAKNPELFNDFSLGSRRYLLDLWRTFKQLKNERLAKNYLSLSMDNVNSSLKRSAPLKWVHNNIEKIAASRKPNGKRTTIWEHMTPANFMSKALMANFYDLITEEELDLLFDKFYIAFTDKKIDDNLAKNKVVTSMGKLYTKIGLTPEETRYLESGFQESDHKEFSTKGKPLRYSLASDDVKNIDRMLSNKSGITSEIGEVLASKLGKKKGKWKFFIPPSADDFMGLMYYMVGKGQQGDADIKFIKEKLVDPFAEGIASLEHYKQQKLQEFKRFKKLVRVDGNIKLEKESPTGFTNEQAVRIYLWTKKGNDVKGITEAERKAVMKYVNDTPALLEYSKHIQNLFAADGGYPDVQDNWLAGTMTIDILEHINEKARAEFLSEWINNTEGLLGKFNNKGEISGPIANKMRAAFGNNYMEALSDVLYRMKHGRAREFGKNRLANQFNNWIANSVGAIMFLNRRSALLQQISLVNFINYSDNNPIAFAKALGDRKQYSKDWVYLFNSDFLKQRRSGLQIDVNEDEIAKAAEQGGNSVKNILAVILKKGFVFTTFADSFAIASGGATFYRNRINTYVKQGMSVEDAESKAFIEFKELTEESQQSSRPDRVSQQQAGSLGRLILAFANTPMQYSRLTKKAAQDLINRRGDWKQNLGKLLYYGAIQNIIFTGLQQALFSLMFDDEDDEIQDMKKISFAANSMVDGFLRGLGFGGAVASVAKNMVMEAIEQSQGRKDYDEVVWEALKLSPPLGSKISKARSVARTFTWKQEREKVFNKGLSLDNPIFMAAGQTVSALTNLPLDRVVRDVDMISTPLRQETEWWQNLAIAFGYGKYELGLLPKAKKKKSNKDGKRGTTKRGKAKRGVTR